MSGPSCKVKFSPGGANLDQLFALTVLSFGLVFVWMSTGL